MHKPITSTVMNCALQAVIWQPYLDDRGPGEPAILVERDASGLLVLTQEGRQLLIQTETLPALVKELKRLSTGGQV
ncbi:hypothetical protein CDR19_04135 [Ectopseudomonas toyotomiensis]|uniref:Uncharacterized protein n=1 Tax=Ectopseudomonas toyotomiensis TaxID=554344 RepID=A0A1I5QYP7_9GAMM|nr:hypothetical protein [Pseudomonas toyotomiensis]PIA74261.1 hypothetical protein CDR19_04135 [Pseudomonas toyotomiensis]SFP51375.1 hypothetical protein SAMN05216177_103201 [Pseudomonas toyotomiensis]